MTLDDLLHDLEQLCTCYEEDDEVDAFQCIYCEAREQIEAQQRTIQLLSDRLESGKVVSET